MMESPVPLSFADPYFNEPLDVGAHDNKSRGHCLLERVSLLLAQLPGYADDYFTDTPTFVPDVLCSLGHEVNDDILKYRPDLEPRVRALVPLLVQIGRFFESSQRDHREDLAVKKNEAYNAVFRWTLQHCVPTWLELGGLSGHENFRKGPPVDIRKQTGLHAWATRMVLLNRRIPVPDEPLGDWHQRAHLVHGTFHPFEYTLHASDAYRSGQDFQKFVDGPMRESISKIRDHVGTVGDPALVAETTCKLSVSLLELYEGVVQGWLPAPR